METNINVQKMGKLRIYLRAGDRVKSKDFISRFFPKTVYWKLMKDARQEGIMNAHIFHTHTSYKSGGTIQHKTVEGDQSGLTVCLELVDEKQKLEVFFKKHSTVLKGKTVIFKEVEYWSTDL